MDQLPMKIKIDDYWKPQLCALLIFFFTSSNLYFTIQVQVWWGQLHTEMFPWCISKTIWARGLKLVGDDG